MHKHISVEYSVPHDFVSVDIFIRVGFDDLYPCNINSLVIASTVTAARRKISAGYREELSPETQFGIWNKIGKPGLVRSSPRDERNFCTQSKSESQT